MVRGSAGNWACAGARPTLVQEALTPTCLHVAVTGVMTARGALSALLVALGGARVGVGRAVFARRRADGDRDALVLGMDPSARRQVEYDDPGEWWRACFDTSAPPPLSEDRAELAKDDDALLEVGATTFAEHRGVPLHVPGMRICYGLGEVAYDEPGHERSPLRSPPPEEEEGIHRGHEVARVLGAALDQRFHVGDAESRPAHYNRLRQPDAPFDRIRVGDRIGYSSAFRAPDLREFLHDHLFRYREYELMLAVRDAVGALDLEPVACWRRFNGRYVLQLWEREASRAHDGAPSARAPGSTPVAA